MNRQRKVVITVTYNDLGIIVDTKAEELDLSAQPNLQPNLQPIVSADRRRLRRYARCQKGVNVKKMWEMIADEDGEINGTEQEW